jgi:hypothetical protein
VNSGVSDRLLKKVGLDLWGETCAPLRGSITWQDYRLGRRTPDPHSGGQRSGHPPRTSFVQGFVQLAMCVFLMTWPERNRLAAVKPLKGQSFQLVLYPLGGEVSVTFIF